MLSFVFKVVRGNGICTFFGSLIGYYVLLRDYEISIVYLIISSFGGECW
ncbi:hypothetical protein VIBNISO65_1110073 [Vibrio nigripulchritudo SO65]|nr:hypothetical protein VIBNIAM115_1260035 [Vibrio nigripulchritudo AM115]CCN41913.1 hypothetical protein VIBNIFTn2_210164 [Vibrio nigripulchritudo FTn2]CCN66294.1 hypothetical protein VIBNIPon4_530079 [Vibrio nigripulchritudo POn4]CCN74651.1 hypothetical protein VIBNISO65_1110073 [Vibrio nigripulchritudo SO65]